MRLGIYSRILKEEHHGFVVKLFNLIKEHGIEPCIYEPYYQSIAPLVEFESKPLLFDSADSLKGKIDYLISIGGDGTLLDTVQYIRDSGVPVAGVNTGRLGFLADNDTEEIESLLMVLKNNSHTTEPRALIQVNSNKPIFEDVNFGLNEFTIHKSDSSSMITIHVYLNGEFLNSYWADGLIISSPTGSTAYSLSCGGPIVFPTSGNFVITPVAPHNLNARPMVIPDSTVISFEVEGRSNSFLCSLDSRYETVDQSFQIALRKENFYFNLVRVPDNHYIKTLREKLRWGEDSRN